MFEYMTIKDGPVIEGLESQEVVYAADQPQYLPLRSLRSKGKWGRVISRWTFTPEQRQAIVNGADVLLELSTFHQPLQPIRMMVSDGKVDHDWVRVVLLEEQLTGKVVDSLDSIAVLGEAGGTDLSASPLRDAPGGGAGGSGESTATQQLP